MKHSLTKPLKNVTSNFVSSNFRKSKSADFRKSKSAEIGEILSVLKFDRNKTEGKDEKKGEDLYVVQD